MNRIINILPIVLLLYAGSGKGQDLGNSAISFHNPGIDSYNLLAANDKKGFWKKAKLLLVASTGPTTSITTITTNRTTASTSASATGLLELSKTVATSTAFSSPTTQVYTSASP